MPLPRLQLIPAIRMNSFLQYDWFTKSVQDNEQENVNFVVFSCHRTFSSQPRSQGPTLRKSSTVILLLLIGALRKHIQHFVRKITRGVCCSSKTNYCRVRTQKHMYGFAITYGVIVFAQTKTITDCLSRFQKHLVLL